MVANGALSARRRVGAAVALPVRLRWFAALAVACWVLVATMRLWWTWLWESIGLFSVPVDMVVWIAAIVATALVAPAVWQRFHHAWVIMVVVGALFVGGTAVVLPPWHDVLVLAWLRTECGPGDCAAPAPPQPYSWRVTGPK